jgi:uncharacterized protein (DUF1778 family)
MTAPRRSARLDLRLTEENRSTIEQAAALAGTNLSDYVTGVTLSAARRDIAAARTITLDAKAWEEFLAFLDEPDTPAMTQLRNRRTRWDA